jgi:MFS family permease
MIRKSWGAQAASIEETLMSWAASLRWLLDRFGTRPILALLLLPQLLALLLLGTSNEAIVIPIYLTLAGVTMGTVQPLQSVILAEIYGIEHFGEIRAVVTASNVLMGALGPALIGLLVDRGVTFD